MNSKDMPTSDLLRRHLLRSLAGAGERSRQNWETLAVSLWCCIFFCFVCDLNILVRYVGHRLSVVVLAGEVV